MAEDAEMGDLSAFIAQHATPYDPATDTYRRPPFAQPVKAGKNSPIYNAHSYHTKVPPEGIVPYIEHYTDPGDLVLDPFCGSGMTGVAALMTGRHAILNDLSPAAVHIARNYCTPVDVAALRREFERIREAVREEFEWLYGATCQRCGGPATIQYTVWSDVFACGRCGGDIVLWDVAVDPDTGKVAERFACPTCGAEWKKRDLRWLRSAPVRTNIECPSCKPARSEHPTTEAEKARIAEIEAAEIPYWYPTTPFDASWEMWRGVHRDQGITDVSKFFTHRNLWAYSRLWNDAAMTSSHRVAELLQFALTGVVNYVNKRQNYGGGGGGVSGTLYVASLTLEKNVWLVLARKVESLLRAFAAARCDANVQVVVVRGSAAGLSAVPDETVDYCFTDPPFGSNIFYADCNLLWEAWLNQGFTDQSQEAVVHVKHKDQNTLPDYARLMADSFREMYRVLKPGRWASVVFHNSDDRIWQTILDAAEAAGFERSETNAFDKVQRSFKGLRGQKGLERVTHKDIVLNLLKPRPGRAPAPNGRTHLVEAEQRVVETVADFLAGDPPPHERTLQHLWNTVLFDLLRAGSVEVSMADVERILAYHAQTFKLADGRYYLRGEAVLGGNVFDLQSDAGAIAWLAAVLANEPQTTGELIPRWQQETAALGGAETGRLDRLLEQNFWPDARTGRWRVPTAAEREKMSARADLGAQAHLRVVRRFLAGEIERRPNDVELAAWVRFCYSRHFYAEAAALFQQIVEERVDPQEYRELKRIAAVCRMRAGQTGE
ncbi:MAG: DNA methylase [Anaerolineales bacterium]|nr:DNA methylase [Anaerolineales bacterium]